MPGCRVYRAAELFIMHPGNVSTGDVTAAADAEASPASLLVEYEPQPVPRWTNATRVNNLPLIFIPEARFTKDFYLSQDYR